MITTPTTHTLHPGLDALSAQALLNTVNNKYLVAVIFDDDSSASSRTYQSTLLGANLIDGELLISEFFPALSIYDMQTMTNNDFWLKIKTDDMYFFIQVSTVETANTYSIVKIQKAYMTQHQRWKPHASFPARTGPMIDIQPNHTAIQKGWLQHISDDGGVIALYGTNTKDMIQKREKFNVAFEFSHEFHPTWRIKIIESTFLRQPCCHLRLRFLFVDLTPIDRGQISEFLHGFNAHKKAQQERQKSAA